MKEYSTYKLTDLPKDQTNIQSAKKITDRAINKAAKSDKNALPSSKKQLSQFKRVHPRKIDVKKTSQTFALITGCVCAVF